MRARNIKPGFFKNEELAAKDPLARILFQGLWCMADREGRLEDRPARIKAEILPYDNCDIEFLLSSLASGADPFVIRYERDGRRFIQVVHFLKHQNPHVKESRSTIPAPGQHSAGTVQAPEEHDFDPVQTPGVQGAGPADVLIPDSLNPDPLESLSKDKQPAAALLSITPKTSPAGKNSPSKGRHFMSHIEDQRIRDEIEEAGRAIPSKRFNTYQWCQSKFIEKKFSPAAILYTLRRIVKEQNAIEDLWPYANRIYEVEYGKFNEREYIERSREYKRELSPGELVNIGVVFNRLAKPP